MEKTNNFLSPEEDKLLSEALETVQLHTIFEDLPMDQKGRFMHIGLRKKNK